MRRLHRAVLLAVATVLLSGCTVNIGRPGPQATAGHTAPEPSMEPTPTPISPPGVTASETAGRGDDPLEQVESQNWTTETRATKHFRLSVMRLKADAETLGVKVKTCVRSLPPGWEGSVRVSADPWKFQVYGETIRAEHDDRFGEPLAEHSLMVGECTTGWITYDMRAGHDVPTGLLYANSLGEIATF